MKSIKTFLAFLLSFLLSVLMAASGPAAVFASTSYSASSDNTHAITADGKTVSYSDITVTKTGNGAGDEADFYGKNAAVFATNGAALTISNATITTNGQYANAVFSYGSGTTVTISDSTINTTQRNSGGIMVTGGGTLNADNLTIVTEGGSSAAIRSDRGGGTMIVDGGSYTANGSGSPAIYSTADITVSNATLKSGTAQAVVVEGGNSVTLTNCTVTGNNTVQNSDKSSYYQAVMLYQSMSGDAAGGSGSFTMTGGSLTSLHGGMFFVTNAAYTINLNGVGLTYADDELLRACAAGWGNSGSNGGEVTLNANNQVLKGTIIIDDVSELTMSLSNGSSFTGTFDNEGEVNVTISEDSSWTLTSDCSITSLNCDSASIDLNGHTLTVNGVEYTDDDDQTSAVTGLKATVSGTTAQLTWTALSGASSYEIYRSTSDSSGFAKIGTVTATAYTASGLTAGTTYYFKVRALLTTGSYSDYSSAVTAAIPAASVSGLKATVSGTTVKLTWTALSGASSYEIYRSTSASSGFAKIGTVTATAYTASGLTAGTTYYFKVRALLTTGSYSDYSSAVTAAIPAASVSGLKATVSGTTVKLTWTALSGASSYEIYRSTSASSGFAKIGTVTATAYTASGLTAGTTYYFKVRALLTTGSYSDYSSAVTVAIPAVSVSGLKATVSGTTVKLTWTKLSGAKSYEVYRSTSASSGFAKIGTSTSAAYNASGLIAGTTYYFKVRALLTTGSYSNYSSAATAVIPAASVSGLKATISGTTAKLTWTKLSGAKSYEIYRSTSASSGFAKIGTSTSAAYNASGLIAGTTYYFKVRALMTSGSYSNYSSAATAVIPAASVSGLKATISGTTAKLTWTKLSGAKSYEIYRSTSASSGFAKIGTSASAAYNASGLIAGTTYYFKVRALMTTGSYSNYSSAATAVIPAASVSGLKATVSGTTAQLTWTALTGAKSYEIYRSTSASSGFTKIGTATSAAYNASGLSSGKTWYFRVRALLTTGKYSNYSSVISVKVVQMSGLKVSVSGTTAKLTWTKLSGAKSYEVYRSTSASSGFTKIGTTTGTAYNSSGLNYGTTYYFKVIALLSNAASVSSSTVSAKTANGQVSGLKASVSGQTAKLSWNKLAGAKSYVIYRSTKSNSGFAKIGTATGNAYNDGGLDYASTYYFKVLAVMPNGNSAYSAAVKAVIPATSVNGLKATVSGQTAKLTWTALSGTKSYEVYRSTSASSGFAKIGTSTSAAYTASGLNYGTTYYFKIRALLTTNKYSNYSSAVKAVIPTASVSGLKATVSGQTANLTWTALSGIKSYEIWRSTSASSGFAKIGTSTSAAYTASGLNYGTTYYFKIRVLLTTNKYSNYSAAVKAAIPAASVSGLKATVSGQTAKLTWTALSGTKSYEIWRSTSASSGFAKIGTTTSAAYTASGLNYGTTYYFKIRALLTTNQYSNFSAAVQADIAPDEPEDNAGYCSWTVTNGTLTIYPDHGSSCSLASSRGGTEQNTDVFAPWYNREDVTSIILTGTVKAGSSAYALFAGLTNLKNISGLNGLDISSVTDMSAMFRGCSSLTDLDGLRNWNVSKVTDMSAMFSGCSKLSDASPLAGWQLSASADITDMFANTGVHQMPFTNASAQTVSAAAAQSGSSAAEINEECSEDGSSCTLTEKACTETECTITSKVCVIVGDQKACAEPIVTVIPVLTETPVVETTPTAAKITASAPTAETSEECSEDGSTCTYTEKVCTNRECAITSKVCVVVGDQKACADPVMTVVPMLTETPAVTAEATEATEVTEEAPAVPTVTEIPAVVGPVAEVSEECSEDGSTCTYTEKVCTGSECTITSKICVVVGDQKACAEPVVTVAPMLTLTPVVTEEATAEPTAAEEATAEPTATEEAIAEPAATEEATAEPAATEEATAEPAATEEAAAEPAATEEATAEPAATEEAAAEPAATEEATAEPAATEEATAEPEVTEEVTAEPAATEEATAEPVATEEATAEPAATEEATAEPVATEEATAEPAATEDLTIREIHIEDLAEDTISFKALESYTIQPQKLKIVPEAADWADLTFKLDDETVAAFKSADIELIKSEGLTINGLLPGSTILRIQAGDVEKTVTLVITLSEADIRAALEAEAAAQAAAEATPEPEPAAE